MGESSDILTGVVSIVTPCELSVSPFTFTVSEGVEVFEISNLEVSMMTLLGESDRT